MTVVKISLYLEVHDNEVVVKAGDETIKDGWGYESIAAYLAEGESDENPVAQSMYEILTAGLWEKLEKHGVLGGTVEIVNDNVEVV